MAKRAKQLEVQTRYIYNSEIQTCPHCGKLLQPQAYYQWRKTVQQLNGVVYVAHCASECVNSECSSLGAMYPSARAQSVTLPGCTYGRDVIAQIGWWRENQHLDRGQIHQELKQRVQISEREIDYLYNSYEILRGCLEQLKKPEIFRIAEQRGGLLLSLDGLSPEGANEQLWVVREVQLNLTLVGAWLPKVDHLSLAALLKPVIDLGLPILGTISDKQPCVEKALELVLPAVPHAWCQSHYLGHLMEPVYERDLALKTELRQQIRTEIRPLVAEVLAQNEGSQATIQIVSGALADQPLPAPTNPGSVAQPALPAALEPAQVVRGLVSDIKQALSRKGRAPFNLSGVPMFADLCAIQDTLEECLRQTEYLHLRSLHTTLSRLLPKYATAFQEVKQAQIWTKDIAAILDAPLPTEQNPGAEIVEQRMKAYLEALSTQPDLSPWLAQVRTNLITVTNSYWIGLFPCYNIPGLPRTNNDLESLFGKTKRGIRRRLGISQLREPLLRHAAWAILQIDASSSSELQHELERVGVAHYWRERRRYEQRQQQFRQRRAWRRNRDAVLQHRLTDWTQANSKC